jgi:stage V sporulation protein K
MSELSRHARLLLDVATQEAKRRGHNPVSPIHLVAGLIRQDRARATAELGDQAIQDVATGMKGRSTEVLDTLSIEKATEEALATIDDETSQWEVLRANLTSWVSSGDTQSETASATEAQQTAPSTEEMAAVARPAMAEVVNSLLADFGDALTGAQLQRRSPELWSAHAEQHRAILDDVWNVTVAIAGADGTWAEPEDALVTSVFTAHLATRADLAASARSETVPGVAGQPSQVLSALARSDAAHGTTLAKRYALRLVEIGRLVASADDNVTTTEAGLLDQLRLAVRSQLAVSAPGALDPTPTGTEPSKVDEVLAKLDALIGLHSVKQEIRTRLEWFRINDLRRKRGLPTEPQSLHMAFLGNPGTGKTTVARLVGELFAAAGALRKGHLVEADRSQFVAQYLGQTSHLVNETVKKAKGGVLFVDEAYSLAAAAMSGYGGDSYEREAVDTLVKLMEDHRDDLIVILAGYSGPMRVFLASNEGLASRVPAVIDFEDYSDMQLAEVWQSMVALNGRVSSPAASEAVNAWLAHERSTTEAKAFGNARAVRNVLEAAMRSQAVRLAALGDLATDDELATIEASDIPTVAAVITKKDDPQYL